MRAVKNVSISLPSSMLKDAERVAKLEGRTKSELFREALRRYMREREWDAINAYGQANAKALGIKPQDVNRLIHEYRAERRAKRA